MSEHLAQIGQKAKNTAADGAPQAGERQSRTGRMHRVGPAVAAAMLTALIVLLNAFPEKVGYVVSATDPESFVPMLAPEFQAHLPLLNVWLSLALALALARLAYGRWTVSLRWADLGLRLVGIVVLASLVFGGPIIRVDYGGLDVMEAAFGWSPWTPDTWLKLGLGLLLAALVIGCVQKLAELLGLTPRNE
jgi:hypothetical protein